MPGKSRTTTTQYRCSHELQVALAIPPFSEGKAVATFLSTEGTGTWLVEGSRFDLPILVAGALVDTIARWAGTHTNDKGTNVVTAKPK